MISWSPQPLEYIYMPPALISGAVSDAYFIAQERSTQSATETDSKKARSDAKQLQEDALAAVAELGKRSVNV
jgi:hypothetical protein